MAKKNKHEVQQKEVDNLFLGAAHDLHFKLLENAEILFHEITSMLKSNQPDYKFQSEQLALLHASVISRLCIEFTQVYNDFMVRGKIKTPSPSKPRRKKNASKAKKGTAKV